MSDREIARRALDLQARARDIRVVDLPGYMVWSKKKLADGELPGFIAHLDATCMWLLPEEVAAVTDRDFEEMLQDLKDDPAFTESFGA